MLKLIMIAAVIAVGFVSMKSCDSSVSMQNQQMLSHERELENKLQQSEAGVRDQLEQSQ